MPNNKEYYRKYRLEHLEASREYTRKYYLNHREKEAARKKAYREAHPERYKELSRKYEFEHREDKRRYRLDHREKRKEYEQKNKSKIEENRRKRILKTNYGITPTEYEKIFVKQGGVCAICGKSPGEQRLNVDHGHDTGRVRGLLCRHCNLMLGYAKDSRSVLQNALIYLIQAQLETDQSVV